MNEKNSPSIENLSAHEQNYACLLFDADDAVHAAEMFSAPKKAVAMQRAMSHMNTRAGVVGFQLWQDGAKVAEFFPERHRAAGRMVGGPVGGRQRGN